MAGIKLPPGWRRVFLRALARTGNVRAAAAEARVDPATTYDHRAKDNSFAVSWAAAKVKAAEGAARRRAKEPGPLVARRSKRHGVQMVAAAAGRWCAEAERCFFAALAESGSLRLAAAAAGVSATSIYQRRDHYPDFAAGIAAVRAEGRAELPDLLSTAAVRSLEGGRRPRGLPNMSVDQARDRCRAWRAMRRCARR